MTIRVATLADIDRGLEILRTCFPGRVQASPKPFGAWLVNHPQRLVLIGERSVGCAQFSWDYGSEPRSRLVFLAAIPHQKPVLEPLRMVRAMLEWSKVKGAKGHFRLNADTGTDFSAFSARLGGQEGTARFWNIPLE